MNTQSQMTPEEVDSWFDEESEDIGQAAEATILDPAEKYARSQLRVVRETKDYQLDYLRHALQPGRELIDTAPGYQEGVRNFV